MNGQKTTQTRPADKDALVDVAHAETRNKQKIPPAFEKSMHCRAFLSVSSRY
jgi:hypothetical protein